MTVRDLINSDLIIGGNARIVDYETLEYLTDPIDLSSLRFSSSDLLDREIHAIYAEINPEIKRLPELYYSLSGKWTAVEVY